VRSPDAAWDEKEDLDVADESSNPNEPTPQPAPEPRSGMVATPPAPPRSVLTEEPSKWPKVIGIVSIILGSLELLLGVVGTTFMFFTPKLVEMGTQNDPSAAAWAEEIDWSITMGTDVFLSAVVGVIWSIVLLTSGVMLVRRSRNARFTNLLWAAIRLFLSAAGIYMTLRNLPRWVEHLETLSAQGNELATMMLDQANATVSIAIIVILGVPYPLFILVWFLRPKIKRECAEW
jgi:hypothetical protein